MSKFIYYHIFSMQVLKYYIPLIKIFNKKNYKNILLWSKSRPKSNMDNQSPSMHLNYLNEISKKYNFELKHIDEFQNKKAILFIVEGVLKNNILTRQDRKYKIISLTYCWDFYYLYDNYINYIDYCIFSLKKKYVTKNFQPEESVKQFNKFNNNMKKNLFFGTPYLNKNSKNNFNNNNIIKKYNLPTKKYIFVFLPALFSSHFTGTLDFTILEKIFTFFTDKGFYLLLKTRNKNAYQSNFLKKLNNIQYFTDNNYFPHVSSELINISSFILNFNSSGFIEALYFKKPIINFDLNYMNNHRKKVNTFLINKYVQYIEGNYNNLELNYNKITEILEQNKFDDFDLIEETPVDDIYNLIETL